MAILPLARHEIIMPPACRPYRVVLQTIIVVWLIVAVAVTAWKWSAISEPGAAAESLSLSAQQIAIIALASGVLGIIAILPGWSILLPKNANSAGNSQQKSQNVAVPNAAALRSNTAPQSDPGAAPSPLLTAELSPLALAIERLGHAFLIGMLIRLAGTVALFLASSYYMNASATRIGIWVLGWHLLFLFSEVITLSRQIRVAPT